MYRILFQRFKNWHFVRYKRDVLETQNVEIKDIYTLKQLDGHQ